MATLGAFVRRLRPPPRVLVFVDLAQDIDVLAPVLAAPAAFMVIARARLAAAGGFDDRRFPEAGADLDLGLRLRRMGFASLLLGGGTAASDRDVLPAAGPAEFAGLEAAELAAAAHAYPRA